MHGYAASYAGSAGWAENGSNIKAAAMTERDAAKDGPRWAPTRRGLSGKLLVLTILFVMIAEVLIYVPSIANFRLNWLNDRLAAARTATLVLDAAPRGMVPEGLARQILDSIGARAVAVKMGDQRRLLAVSAMPPSVDREIDLRNVSAFRAIVDAFEALFVHDQDVMRVVGPAPEGGEFLEVVLNEAPLRNAMLRFSANILLLSLIISAITATLVYFALHYLFVRPMRRITANMTAFHQDPENPARVIATSGRQDEIGTAEHELAAMQRDLASMLHQKSRLAALGLAVSKINHDLRNLLSSAQLFSDRLSSLPDPHVQRFAPKLMRALERAIAFCQSTLSYGKAQEAPPDRRMVALEPLIEEVHETLGLVPDGPIRWITAVERGLSVDADPDQLFRVLLNLSRNAVQALESRSTADPARDQIRITGCREGTVAVIEVADTGPGVSENARTHLFEAFASSTRTGGTGLGLTIACELVRAHGGDIRLIEGTIGATFRITIPDRAVELNARRGERARA
jgi:signal transduction histidine kinase